jgi:hypothetical protein
MNAIFLCVLTEHPSRPNMWGPKVRNVLLPAMPRLVYAVIGQDQLKPVAVGLVEVTQVQFDAVDALAGVWMFDAADWRTKTVSQIPAATRQRLNTLLTDRGISAGIQLADTVMQAVGKIVTAVGGDPQALLAKYMSRTGTDI